MSMLTYVVGSIGILLACAASAHPADSPAVDSAPLKHFPVSDSSTVESVFDGSAGGAAAGLVLKDSSLLLGFSQHAGHASTPDFMRQSHSQSLRFAYPALAVQAAPATQTGVEPALGPPKSYMRRHAGLDSTDPAGSSHWLDAGSNTGRVISAGYAWRRVSVEGSMFSSLRDDAGTPQKDESLKLASRSTRLSFKPLENLAVQISRGTLSGIDQIVPNGDIRRTTLSATYAQTFGTSEWQTTFAWGRNARKQRESVTGYIMESTMRFHGAHVLFGRLEQVGSDELLRQDETLQRAMFKLNKLTLGYFHDMRTSGPVKMDFGGLISRHFTPGSMVQTYGDMPTALMFFVRLKLQ